ncbi:MAG: hypothetical protein WBQ60_13155 [Asticcacaulis sp.]
MHDPVTQLVVTLFSMPGMALSMAAVILLASIGIIIYSNFTDYGPLQYELRDRWNLISGLRGAKGRQHFFEQFSALDSRFASVSSQSSTSAALVLGWSNFRSMLVDTESGHFATSVRAAEAFDRFDEPARVLEWWANIMVAIGLVITFLGIVAALTEATAAMGQAGGSNSGAMEAALMGLLAIAATKFWTSIAGVLASIILRVVARFRRKRIGLLEASLFENLDSCVQFMPPEKVIFEQLKSLKRVEIALSQLPAKD